jgi:hypothetical protein
MAWEQNGPFPAITHARGLFYFTNYHISDYGDFRLYNKTLDELNQHTRRVFIGQRVVHIDQEHQWNKPDKGLSEKTESNKKRTRVKEQYSRTSIFERIYQHCTPRDYREFNSTANHH